ncbi:MAG: LysR family transcriptional regulator [Salinisphaeraceae bacterium]|jgi:DNA-binding transcriptional LysR family regulator|nr:LysR family transcriptional regulator [Salinisphaeraceae bacterium]
MNSRLTIDSLQVMTAIAETGSFAAAAAKLHRVPSAISHTIKKLENELGVALFQRVGRSVELTAAGVDLLKEGRKILRAVADLESRVRMAADGWEAEITLALDHQLPFNMLVPALRAFDEMEQATRVHVIREAETGPWDALVWRRADLAIGRAETLHVAGDCENVALGHLDMDYVVAAGHPLEHAETPFTGTELGNFRFLATADTSRGLPPEQHILAENVPVSRLMDLRDKLEALRAGLGFGLLPRPLAELEIRAGRLARVTAVSAVPADQFAVAWRRESTGRATQWFRDYFQDCGPAMLERAFS